MCADRKQLIKSINPAEVNFVNFAVMQAVSVLSSQMFCQSLDESAGFFVVEFVIHTNINPSVGKNQYVIWQKNSVLIIALCKNTA